MASLEDRSGARARSSSRSGEAAPATPQRPRRNVRCGIGSVDGRRRCRRRRPRRLDPRDVQHLERRQARRRALSRDRGTAFPARARHHGVPRSHPGSTTGRPARSAVDPRRVSARGGCRRRLRRLRNADAVPVAPLPRYVYPAAHAPVTRLSPSRTHRQRHSAGRLLRTPRQREGVAAAARLAAAQNIRCTESGGRRCSAWRFQHA